MSANNKNLLRVTTEYTIYLIIALAVLFWTIFKRILMMIAQQKQLKDLEGEVVVITGAGSGIGRLLALRLIECRAVVVVIDINQKGVDETVEMCRQAGGKAFSYYCDISQRENVYAVAKQIVSDVGPVSILVNNAGIVTGKYFLETSDALLEKTMNVNVMAHFWTTKAFLPSMIERNHGHVVNIASMAGLVGLPKLVDYSCSKFAAVGFHMALRIELEKQGVTGVSTSVICPYFIQQTGMFNDVSTRYLPLLSSEDVADRILLAIRRDDNMVFLPGYFRILTMWRDVLPWEFLSIFLRNLVPDANPMKHGPAKSNGASITNNNNNNNSHFNNNNYANVTEIVSGKKDI